MNSWKIKIEKKRFSGRTRRLNWGNHLETKTKGKNYRKQKRQAEGLQTMEQKNLKKGNQKLPKIPFPHCIQESNGSAGAPLVPSEEIWPGFSFWPCLLKLAMVWSRNTASICTASVSISTWRIEASVRWIKWTSLNESSKRPILTADIQDSYLNTNSLYIK